MSRVLYRRFTVGSSDWRIMLADPDDPELAPDSADDASADGATLKNECVILINRDVPAKRRPDVIAHEFVHVGFAASGANFAHRISSRREEQIAHALGPFLAQALISGGFWKTPRGEE